MAPVAVTDSAFAGRVGIYIYVEPAKSTADPTLASRSGYRHESGGGLGGGFHAIGDQRE